MFDWLMVAVFKFLALAFSCMLLSLALLSSLETIDASSLDIDELKTSLYSVHISEKPVVRSGTTEEIPNGFDFGDEVAMEISSKFGQQYVCHYKTSIPKATVDVEQPIESINITDLLEPMRGSCLLKTKDWWSYEFCFGQKITQFHMEQGKKVGDTILLGKYLSDKTWNADDVELLKKSPLNRYHTQKYVNGSICDLTKKARQVEVRFSCVEGSIDHIGAIAELESCSYTLFVYTSKICHHPYLRPPMQAKPHAIECQPIVSQDIYSQYLESQTAKVADTSDAANQKEADDQAEEEGKVDIARMLKEADIDITKTRGSVQSVDTLSEKDSKLQLQLLDMLSKAMMAKNGKGMVSKHKESIRKFVSSQFDDIIKEATDELKDEEGEDAVNSLKDINNLKGIMSQVLDGKLKELDELERMADEDKSDETDQSEKSSASEAIKEMSFEDLKKKVGNVKLETIMEPQQLEVEMIDIEDIKHTSEYYDAAQKAKNKADSAVDDKNVKTVIAILRPMQEKGTRQEEITHKKLQQGYGKKWTPEKKDEL